jgi:putative ABC transport system ATP-binding protein
MIVSSQLTYQYTQGASLRFPDVQLHKGEHALLLGNSGSGKTTLLHLLGGLLRGYRGTLQINSTELGSLSEAQLDTFRAEHIGFVFQKNHLINALTVEKNVAMAPYLAGKPVNTTRVHQVLDELGLLTRRKVRVSELSQGQAQRVAIARAVINNPQLILADELTSALDDTHAESVISLLLSVTQQHGSTLVIATHDQRIKSRIQKHIHLMAP